MPKVMINYDKVIQGQLLTEQVYLISSYLTPIEGTLEGTLKTRNTVIEYKPTPVHTFFGCVWDNDNDDEEES